MHPYKKLFVAFLLFLVTACATPQPTVPIEELKARANDAMRLQFRCGLRNIPEVDDGISDAKTVALALALRCHREYQQATEAFGYATLDNKEQRQMFMEESNRSEVKIQVFLPIVMDYRASTRKKTP